MSLGIMLVAAAVLVTLGAPALGWVLFGLAVVFDAIVVPMIRTAVQQEAMREAQQSVARVIDVDE